MAIIKILLIVVFGLILAGILETLRFTDVIFFNFVEKGLEYKCEYLSKPQKVVGPEDFVYYDNNILLTASDNKLELEVGDFPKHGPHNILSGSLYAILTDKGEAQKIEMKGYPKNTDFRPHGIYFDNERRILWVINHAFYKGGERVDRFQIAQDNATRLLTAKYLDSTFFDIGLYNGALNDLIAINEKQFFITKFLIFPQPILGHGANGPLKSIIELILRLARQKLTYVLYCEYKADQQADCTKLENTASILNNGISWDRKNKVLINDVFLKQTRVFELNLQALSRQQYLNQIATIDLNGHPDNIDYDIRNGVYYVSGPGNLYQLDQYLTYFNCKDKRPENSNFTVFVDEIDAKTLNVTNLFMRTDAIKGSSAAFKMDKNTLVIGSFIDTSLQICKRK